MARAGLKRAALYMRVSTVDQHPETQLLDLRQMASQRGYEIIHEYADRISGMKAKLPGLDAMMADARHGRFRGPTSLTIIEYTGTLASRSNSSRD